MKIGVVGFKGQLGSELVRQGCIPLHGQLVSPELMTSIRTVNPDAVVNCAAVTNVDACQDEQFFRSLASNFEEVAHLSNFYKGYLIHISTDYIFDGTAGPYSVNDAPNPLNFYGWQKLGAELIVKRRTSPWLIVRTTILFSKAANNFVSKIIAQLKQGKQVLLYQPDLRGTPTYVPALAKELIRIIKAEYTGIAHIAGQSIMTRLFFAQLIAETFNFNQDNITPVDEDPGGAPRPQNAGLICDHSSYRQINSHDPRDGLMELAKIHKESE